MSVNLLHLLSSGAHVSGASNSVAASPSIPQEAPFASYLDALSRQQFCLQTARTSLPLQGSLASLLLRKQLEDQVKVSVNIPRMFMPKSLASDYLVLLAKNAKLMDSAASRLNTGGAVSSSPQIRPQKSLGTSKSRRGRIATFTQKMHEMLSDLEKETDGKEIATFLPHGRAFVILKPKVFAEKVMPKYFQMSRFSSFQRQLNLYEFQRIKDGPDKGAYYHRLFVRDQPNLCKLMIRVKIKGDRRF